MGLEGGLGVGGDHGKRAQMANLFHSLAVLGMGESLGGLGRSLEAGISAALGRRGQRCINFSKKSFFSSSLSRRG